MKIICVKCKQEKDEIAFSNHPQKHNGYASWCMECANRRNQRPYYREQRWAQQIWRKYGLFPEQYYAKLKEQGGVCEICGQPEKQGSRRLGEIVKLAVDHSHVTQKVRGLLCSGCNAKLGALDQDDWMQKARTYLEKYT